MGQTQAAGCRQAPQLGQLGAPREGIREPAAVKWTVGDDAYVVRLAQRQQGCLDVSTDEVVANLVGGERLRPQLVTGCERVDELGYGEIRTPHVPDFASLDEVLT